MIKQIFKVCGKKELVHVENMKEMKIYKEGTDDENEDKNEDDNDWSVKDNERIKSALKECQRRGNTYFNHCN